jgi:hypothetical protein
LKSSLSGNIPRAQKSPANCPDLFVKIYNVKIYNLVMGMVMVMMAAVMMVLGVRRNNRPNENHKGDGGKE